MRILSILLFLVLVPAVLFAGPGELGLFLTPISLAKSAAGDSDRVPVEFEFHHQLSPSDSGVGLNGSFNNWGDVYKCRQVEPNVWIRVLDLLPGNYQYKFVTYIDTVGQAGVTGWFTDPLNPDYGGPYRDSYLTVSDPMIYYFLPVRDSEISDATPTITAKISYAYKSQLDVESIEFKIDGIAIPNAARYYDAETRRFSYTPEEPLDFAVHTAYLKVQNTDGSQAELETSFTIVKGVIEAPLTLLFDARSPRLDLVNVPSKATIEWMDVPLSHQLSDDDGDGLFEKTVLWKPDVPHQYRVVVDEQIYLENDPNNPFLSETFRSVLIKRVDPQPRFTDFTPRSGTVLTFPTGEVGFAVSAVPSDSGYAIDPATIRATLDGQDVTLTIDDTVEPTRVSFVRSNLAIGRHVIRFEGADIFGNAAHPALFVVGVYPPESGFHYLDAEDDDTGDGDYTYPAEEMTGAAEIRAVHIRANDSLDSLQFTIDMENIDDATRLGFLVTNTISRELTEAPEDLELEIPQWTGRGVYATLASPTSASFRPLKENQFFKDAAGREVVAKLNVKESTLAEAKFQFSVSLHELEGVLGDFNKKWYFTLYSFLQGPGGSYEVDPAHGGLSQQDEPDVYDIAFCNSDLVQKRLLANYILDYKIGGPRMAAIGTEFRGAWGVLPQQIHPQLGSKPRVVLRTNGGVWYADSVRIVGQVSDTTISQVWMQYNDNSELWPVQEGRFQGVIPLRENDNLISARATLDDGSFSQSEPVVFQHPVDHAPVVFIKTVIQDSTVTLDGSDTYSPDNATMRYRWTQDADNPEQVIFSEERQAITSFVMPKTFGEYYYTLKVSAGSHSGWARTVVVVDSSGAHTVDPDTWHPSWIDRAVAYEIYVKSFSPTGKLSVIKSRLAELKELGVNVIYLRPIYPGTAIHGYWITDYYDVNPDYGTQSDLKRLVVEAHRAGIKVIMDYVVNHTVDVHPFMLDALAFGPDSPFHNFYMWNPDGTFHHYYTWVNLPSINFEWQYTQDYLINMAKWWVQKFRLDGFRCDVAHRIEKDRPSGPAFWQRWRRELKQIKPDLWLLAEAEADDPVYYDRKFDSAYDYRWFNALRDLCSGVGQADALHRVVQFYESPGFPPYAVPKRSLEDFDGGRFIAQYSVAQVKAAAAVLLTSPGVPMIYAGQEVGEKSDRGLVHWSDPEGLRDFYKTLVHIRRDNPAISTGRYRPVSVDNGLVYAMMRSDAADSFVVVANFNNKVVDATLTLDMFAIPPDTTFQLYMNDLLTGISTPFKPYRVFARLQLQPYEVRIMHIASVPTEIKSRGEMPYRFELFQNFPNPFNPVTEIRFSIGGSKPETVKLQVYNILGQRVRTLVDQKREPGMHKVIWDGRNEAGVALGSGMYIITMITGQFKATRKMLLLR